MRFIFGFFILIISLPLASKISLKTALELAYKKDLTTQIRVLDKQISLNELLSLERKKLFSVQFEGFYRYATDSISIKASDFSLPDSLEDEDIPPNAILISAPRDQFDMKISFIQPIYTGGVLSQAVKIGEMKGLIQEDLIEIRKMELAHQVKTSFFKFLLLQKKKESMNHHVNILTLHLKKLRTLYDAQLINKSDLLETEVKADEILMNMEELDRLLGTERIGFETLCGVSPEEIREQVSFSDPDFEEAMDQCKNFHPVIRTIRKQIQVVEIRKRMVAGQYLPRIYGVSEIHYGLPGINIFNHHWDAYFQAAIGVSMPLFDWNRSRGEREILNLTIEKLKKQQSIFVQETGKKLRVLYLTIKMAEKRMSRLDQLIRKMDEAVSLKEKLLKEKQISNLEFLATVSSAQKFKSMKEEIQVQRKLLSVSLHLMMGDILEAQ